MPNHYIGRESLKRAIDIKGADNDVIIDQHVEAGSRLIDRELGRHFIPKTEKRYYRWPQDPNVESRHRPGQVLFLDEDLLSPSALTGEGDAVVTIPTSEVLSEPSSGPPYSRLEIDRATTDAAAVFQAGSTAQRAIRVTGSWGYSKDTKAAGALDGAIGDTTGTSLSVTDASLIDVGETLLIGTEQCHVTARAVKDTTANLASDLGAEVNEQSVTVTDGTKIKAGEVILLDSERMYAESVSGNVVAVKRAYDGTTLAAHTGAVDVYAFRTLTVTRGENGTTAATHLTAAAISKYAPPADIVALCRAIAISEYEADKGGRTGVVGGGEASIRLAADPLAALWEKAKRDYLKSSAQTL